MCGDVSRAQSIDLSAARRVQVVRELSHGFEEVVARRGWSLVDHGRVPVRVHGVDVYYRRLFDPAGEHFQRLQREHAFQSLTESTKPGTAHRSGIYLTPVRPDGDALRFRLKVTVTAAAQGALPAQFTLPLYPGSVFFMPLSTNRLYVHEIVPSELDAARIPTRLGYVARCSNAEAVHREGHTSLVVARARRLRRHSLRRPTFENGCFPDDRRVSEAPRGGGPPP